MATKKDLIEAQKFSRGRLLSAFLGGAPGGKELEPAKPLRAVFGGVALTAMVLLAGVFIGLLRPGLPSGWENNHLIVARDTGARYVSIEGVLHPVINTVSARMILPAGEFDVISVDQSSLEGIPVGGTIGILGGPDSLPGAGQLDGTGWLACSDAEQTGFWLGGAERRSAAADTGVVVVHEGSTFVVADGYSYRVSAEHETAVLRAIGLDTAPRLEVGGEWIALFDRGADLAPLTVPGASEPSPGLALPVGSVIHETGSPETMRYLLTAKGELAPLSPLAHRLYLLGDGADGLGNPSEVGPAELAGLPTTSALGGEHWPEAQLAPTATSGAPCATLGGERDAQRTVLAASAAPSENERQSADSQKSGSRVVTRVPDGGGALVQPGRSGTLTLIDPTGTSYAVPGAREVGALRLGYEVDDIAVVPAPWLQLLVAGPELTPEAAGATPAGA